MHADAEIEILIVAPTASHTFGGEAALRHFDKLRQRGHSAKLMAHARNRENLERGLPRHVDYIYPGKQHDDRGRGAAVGSGGRRAGLWRDGFPILILN